MKLPLITRYSHSMGKSIAILQSNYIPWKGYFDLINSVNEFVLYDDMQYTRRDWRNRNIIKTPNGPSWLTIPVEVKGKYFQKIKDTVVADDKWAVDHWRSIAHNYSKARFFPEYSAIFENLYLGLEDKLLSQINYRFITAICRILGITTCLSWSMDYEVTGDKTEKLVNLCKQATATEYVSGPAARAYLNEELFAREGIAVSYIDYSGYPEYRQLYPPFQQNVSVVDLIFNEGTQATSHMKSF